MLADNRSVVSGYPPKGVGRRIIQSHAIARRCIPAKIRPEIPGGLHVLLADNRSVVSGHPPKGVGRRIIQSHAIVTGHMPGTPLPAGAYRLRL